MQSQKLSIGFAVQLAIFAVTLLMTVTNATAQADSLSIINPDFSAVPIVCALDYAYQATGGGDCSGPVDPQQDFNSAPGFGWTFASVSPPVGGGTGTGLTDPNSNFFPPSFAGLPFTQAVFLQGNSAALWQTIGGFSAGGTYTLSFYLGSRYYNGGFDGNQTIQALIGDQVIGTWTLTSFTKFTLQRAAFTVSTGGDQILKFVGLASGDHTAFISGVAISPTNFTTLGFFNGLDGSAPGAPLVQGLDGNLYGTANLGGTNGDGTVFKITPEGGLTGLRRFCSRPECADGRSPQTGLMQGEDGDLYGVTFLGGTGCPNGTCGTVFTMSLSGTLWTLHSFDLADGSSPAALLQARDSNFYGVVEGGGANTGPNCPQGCGAVFKMTLDDTLTTIYNFCSQAECADGAGPDSLVQGADGNFYGTTNADGNGANCVSADNCGTVFKITPEGTLTTLYRFCSQAACADGSLPTGLVQATDGNFYGVTTVGGVTNNLCPSGCGTLFRITPAGALTTLYSFCSQAACADGITPVGVPIQATDGNLYATTTAGGSSTNCPSANGCGTLFKITLSGTLAVLHQFVGTDGSDARGLMQATDGNFYGTTSAGGNSICKSVGCGTVYILSEGLGPFVITVPTSREVGQCVRILGTDLIGATSVTFNGVSASFIVVSATEITATVPAGATTGTVEVTTPSGTLQSKLAFHVF
ncbi:MAG: choice-of-anchor tandem repeat GloVer-containing protein [Candidatus Sulfotelmatobacter sp.]